MEAVIEWFREYGSVISSLATIATLFVWIFYAQLLYMDYKRQRQPLILIHQAQGTNLDSMTLVVNMSQEPVHIICVMIIAHTEQGVQAQRITGFRRLESEADSHETMEDLAKQGPLQSGQFLSLNAFGDLLWGLCGIQGDRDEAPDAVEKLVQAVAEIYYLEIRVVGIHNAYDEPIGALRNFKVVTTEDNRLDVAPLAHLTDQMVSRQERETVDQWMEDCIALSTTSSRAPYVATLRR